MNIYNFFICELINTIKICFSIQNCKITCGNKFKKVKKIKELKSLSCKNNNKNKNINRIDK